MPIYEYECHHCGAVMEVIQKSTDAGPTYCWTCCKVVPPKKIISNTTFRLVGPGWGSD